MPAPPPNANGHRRRELRRRVLAEETHCALCLKPVNKTLTHTPGVHGPKCPPGKACPGCVPHPGRAEVDEIHPRSRGGSPLDRNNTALMHRACNQFKSDMTMTQARTKWAAINSHHDQHGTTRPSPIW